MEATHNKVTLEESSQQIYIRAIIHRHAIITHQQRDKIWQWKQSN